MAKTPKYPNPAFFKQRINKLEVSVENSRNLAG